MLFGKCRRSTKMETWRKQETNQTSKTFFSVLEIVCFPMPKYWRTAANKLISTVTILVQNSCHYNISKYILHSYFFNSCIQLKKSTPFPQFFLNSCGMQESFRERTPKSLFYQILTFTISNSIMLKLDVQAVRTKASCLQCTYFKAITFIFQTATKKPRNTFRIFYDSQFLFEVP